MDKLRCWKPGKRCLSVLLSVAMLLGMVALGGVIQAGATIFVEKQDTPPKIAFSAPETIYVNPVTKQVEYFAGQLDDSNAAGNTFGVNTDGTLPSGGVAQRSAETTGIIHFWCNDLDVGYPVTIEISEGPDGYNPSPATASNGPVNWDARLYSGAATGGKSGLVVWKATYYAKGAQYTAYCYSYLFVPDARAISGVVGDSHMQVTAIASGGRRFRQWFDSAFLISGSHYRNSTRNGVTVLQPNGGSNGTSTNANMQAHTWNGVWTGNANTNLDMAGTNYAAGTGGAGDPPGIGQFHTDSSVSFSMGGLVGNDTCNSTRDAGMGYIQVDKSRYTNLNQIPQLKLTYVVGYGWYNDQNSSKGQNNNPHNDASAWVSSQPTVTNQGTTANLAYSTTRNSNANGKQAAGGNGILYRQQVNGVIGPLLDTPVEYSYSSAYNWQGRDGAFINTNAYLYHRFTTRLTYTARDKSNLRAKLCEEIASGIQIDTIGNKAAYKAAIEKVALVLCKPDYIFEYSNGTNSAVMDLGPDDIPGTLTRDVKDQHDLSKTFQGDAYIAKNVYLSSVTGKIVVSEDDTITYYLGNSVYSKYNPNVSAVGYRTKPVGVNSPGTIPPATSGYPLGGTSTVFDPSPGGITRTDIDSYAVPPTSSLYDLKGLAPNAPDAINLNTKLTSGLQWNWFLEPIEYKIVYNKGSDDAIGTMPPDFVQYDTVGQLKPCAFVRPGWTFDYWEFNGNPYWHPYDEFSNMTTADNRLDGVNSSDTVGVITAKAVWKQAEPEPRRLYIDPLGGDFDIIDGIWEWDSIAGLYYIDANNHMVYGNLTGYLPLLTKPGYKHAGDWYFSSSCDSTTAWDRFTFRYLEDVPVGPGLIIYPKWVALSSTIRYNKNFTGNEGSGQNPASQVAYTDQMTKLRTLDDVYDGPLNRYGYEFLGWYPDVEVPAVYRPLTGLDTSKLYGAGATYSYTDLFGSITNTDEEMTLYAVWQAKTYPLQFDVNWHDLDTTISPESPPGGMEHYIMATQNKVYGYTYGQSGTASGITNEWVADPVRLGWTFAGWYTEEKPDKGTRVTPDMTFTNIKPLGEFEVRETLYAHWISGDDVPIDPIMLHPNGGTFIGLPANTAQNFGPRGQGTTIDLTGIETSIIPPAGFKFARWEMDPSVVTENELIDVYDGSVTQKLVVIDNGGKKTILRAVWEEEEFTVIYELNEPIGGTVVPTFPFTLDHMTLSSLISYSTYPYLPLPDPAYSCDGFTLEGYTFDPNGTGTIFQDHKPAPAVANRPTVEQVFANAYREETLAGPVYHLYAVWKKIGGLPPAGEFEPDDGDIPDKPQPPIVDPDGKDGYIVMYFTAPKDVVVVPAYQLQESRRFLEYDKPYGKMPTAVKTDGIFVGWRVVKYGSNGSLEYDVGLLGKMINTADKVDHIYSIWVAPVFEPGYVVTYNANGGTITGEAPAAETRRVVFPKMYGVIDRTYGEFNMPTAQRQDYKFLGWYTQPDGGILVTASTVITNSGKVGYSLPASSGLTNVNDLPVTDILFAHWEKTTSTIEDIWNDVTGWLSSDSLAHLPNWANLTLLGIGLPLLGITSGTFASLSTATIFLACFLGLLFFPLALMLPFLFPVIAALMPVWWPLILII